MTYGFAHRGGAPGPDNTLTAFERALAHGARGLETDAWISLDGAVVLDHDGSVDGPVAGRPRAIADLRRDELPAHIPTLDELYDHCGIDYALAIDVKSVPVAASIVMMALRHKAVHNLWLVTPNASDLSEIDLGGAHRAVTLRGNVIRTGRRHHAFDHAREVGVEAINARWMWWSRSTVDEVHGRGMLAFGYDAQRRRSLERCVRLGLDGVFSDHVDRMQTAIGVPQPGSPTAP
jgi:glycerophosphoryl diester phosphodiesterase